MLKTITRKEWRSKTPVIENIEDLEDGKEIRGFVRSVSDAGVFVDVGKDLAARVQIKVSELQCLRS